MIHRCLIGLPLRGRDRHGHGYMGALGCLRRCRVGLGHFLLSARQIVAEVLVLGTLGFSPAVKSRVLHLLGVGS